MVSSIHSKRTYLSLTLLDLVAMLGSFLLAYAVRFEVMDGTRLFALSMNRNVFIVLFLTVFFNLIFDLYEVKYWVNTLFSPIRIFLSVFMTAAAMSVTIYIFAAESSDFIGRGVLLGALGSYLFFSLVIRYGIQSISKKRVRGSKWLIVGTTDYKEELDKECQLSRFDICYEWLDMGDSEIEKKLSQRIRANSLSGIVICGGLNKALAKPLMGAKFAGLKVYDFQFFFERVWGKVAVRCLRPGWFIFSHGFNIVHEKINGRIKMILDAMGASLLLVLTFPVMLLTAIVVCLDSKGGAFYKQKRVGLGGKVFTIYKFRSMKVDAEANGAQWAKQQDDRVTRVGKFIRLTRMDELPQLLNILKGEMSFVGPRPERPEFTSTLEKEIPYYNLRHLVRPGLTGWAQVTFSYGASKEDSLQKLQYELFYIKNHSIWLDMLIVFKTFMVVFLGRGR